MNLVLLIVKEAHGFKNVSNEFLIKKKLNCSVLSNNLTICTLLTVAFNDVDLYLKLLTFVLINALLTTFFFLFYLKVLLLPSVLVKKQNALACHINFTVA